MSTLKQKLRKHLAIRPRVLTLCIIGLGCLLIAPVFGARESTGASQYIVYDDISNTIKATPETGATPDNNGNNDDGVDSSNPGGQGGNNEGGSHDNNGHGNNEDGVDSSNPGQGQGGPNGGVDESCDGTGDCIDDEAGNGNAESGR